ncbi:MAG: DNA cytosine methyltransferase [Calditrichaeota bacterium]|jgi:DNA (cytosine-5)-methyltransferase 1|nr:DNA cytosine methyltransferase [Calditrichota bacterium]
MHKVIDLFSGCGGLTEGFEKSGLFETVAGVEWDKAARETLVNRLKEHWNSPNADEIITRFDIQRTDELFSGWHGDAEYGSHQGFDKLLEKNPADLVIGGPPCQAYSVAGRVRDKNGMRDDYRNYLFESYLKVVSRYRPRFIVFENVPGMLSAKPGGIPITDRIYQAFFDAGYYVPENLKEMALFDFSRYSVPQKRKRVIIIGADKSAIHDPEVTVGEIYSEIRLLESDNYLTASEALSGLDSFYPAASYFKDNGKKYSHKPITSEMPNHTPRYHSKRDIKIFRILAEDIASGRNEYTSSETLKTLYTEMTGKTSNVHKYHVLRSDSPSNTIPAHLFKDGLRHIHPDPEQARSITVREAARFQSFDDDFVFLGSVGDQYKMIGNAVPPIFAEKLASILGKFLY